MALADLERLRAVTGLEDAVTRRLQGFSDQRAQARLVLHEQDRLGAAGDIVRGDRGRGFRLRFARPGQVDLEDRALARLAVHEQMTAALLHDAEDGGESEARPL